MSTAPVDLILHDLADQLRKDPAPARAEMSEFVQSCVNPLTLVEQVHRASDDGAYLRDVLSGQQREPHKRQVEIAVAQRLALHAFALLVEDLGAARRRAKDLLDIARRITGLDEQVWVTHETNIHGIHDATLQQRGDSWRVVYNGAVMAVGDNMHLVSEAGGIAIERQLTATPAQPTFKVGDQVRYVRPDDRSHAPDSMLPALGSVGTITEIDDPVRDWCPIWVSDIRCVSGKLGWYFSPSSLELVTPGRA